MFFTDFGVRDNFRTFYFYFSYHSSSMLFKLIIVLCLSVGGMASISIKIDPSVKWVKWEGWGCSLAWWAKVFGDRNDVADVLFSFNSTAINNVQLPGLGFNIARYNAGACSWNTFDGKTMEESPNIIPSRQIEGFWLDWENSDPSSSSWDWNVDQNQIIMLSKAKSRNADKFELFSNSPMWWMLHNLNPSGANVGSENNLQPWNYKNHVMYLLNIASYAGQHWDIDFNYVEAFNEPMSNWWTSTNNQEGCHFSSSSQNEVLTLLHDEIGAYRLDVQITSSDENSYTQAIDTYSDMDVTVKGFINKINVHGYEYGDGRRDVLYDTVNRDGKVLWNSEYGDGDSSGAELINNLNLDFKWLHMAAWVYWQPLDKGGWGLIEADLDASTLGDINTKYFVLAHYTRHILVNDDIIENDDKNTITSYSDMSHRLTVVTFNPSEDTSDICFDLSMFKVLANDVAYWVTNVDSNVNTDKYSSYVDTITNMQSDNGTICLQIGPFVLVTLEIQVALL